MAWLCFWYRIAKCGEITGVSKEHAVTCKAFGGTDKVKMSAFIMDEPAVAFKHWKLAFSAVFSIFCVPSVTKC